MSNFRTLSGGSFGGSFSGGEGSLSLTVPLTPHAAAPSPTIVGPGGTGGSGTGPAEVRLAGVDTKEKMYEPKQRKKLVRVLTVVAYLFFVSLAAAMLSLYYVFLWNGSDKAHSKARVAQRYRSPEQVRVQEEQALRQLQDQLQEQLRFIDQLRVEEQRLRVRKEEQERLALALQQLTTTTTPTPDFPDTENPDDDEDDDEVYTPPPALLPVLRHRGGIGGGLGGGDLDEDRGLRVAPYAGDAGGVDNDIPRARPPSSALTYDHVMAEGAPSGSSRTASVFGGHKALRHANLHNLLGLRAFRTD